MSYWLADVDAITISLAQLSDAGTVSMTVAAQSIVIAAIANTIAKGAIVVIGGASPLKRALLPGMLLVLVMAPTYNLCHRPHVRNQWMWTQTMP